MEGLGRDGPVTFMGAMPNTLIAVTNLAKRLAKDGHRLELCYEAGCCGYVIYRHLTDLGHGCTVVATSMIPRKPGERIKTDRRDSQKLAILHRSGDLTRVWVPDEGHEAMRDLTRARVDASMQLMRARQQLLAFLLRHGRTYQTGKHWTQRHRSWLAGQTFDQPAHQIVFQDYLEAVWAAQDRRDQLIGRITTMSETWPMGPIVEALRSLRGLDFISAVTFVAAIGDLGRFETARQLMAYLGLVPSEQSSGERIRRGGITKTGNGEARRMLIEAAWSYRYARIRLRLHLLPFFGKYGLPEITPRRVQEYRVDRTTTPRAGKVAEDVATADGKPRRPKPPACSTLHDEIVTLR